MRTRRRKLPRLHRRISHIPFGACGYYYCTSGHVDVWGSGQWGGRVGRSDWGKPFESNVGT